MLVSHRVNDRLGRVGIHFGRRRSRDTRKMTGSLNHHALQTQAQAQRRDTMLARPAQRTELSFNSSNAEASGNNDRINASELAGSTFGSFACIRRNPADIDPRVVCEAAVLDCFRYRQIGVVQVDVLANESNLKAVLGGMHALQQFLPFLPVNVTEGQSEPLDEVGIEPLSMQRQRHVVDGGDIGALDDGVTVHIAHERYLRLDAFRQRAIGAKHQRIRRDANRAQCTDGVLRRLRLQLTCCGQERNQRHVHKSHV